MNVREKRTREKMNELPAKEVEVIVGRPTSLTYKGNCADGGTEYEELRDIVNPRAINSCILHALRALTEGGQRRLTPALALVKFWQTL
jgi:hypothetical protein